MKRLTQKQENFCLAYIETRNASEAYRRVYNAKGMKPETVNRNAKALLDNNKIATRLEELRKPVTESAQITLAQHLSTLEELRELAKEEGKYGPAIQAEIARGKAAGLYVERSHIDGEITVRWDE
ncbi:terminase small subunit [Oxalobacter sp. OxGP1]|uniref:terminase small subunit n=1 Tax=Oxalobacter paeniformigenes TaxID=2946594 RepID=UPI0022AFFCDD|nr:terminase small subunit [Oxalobacter paeniformigenes]MCZ4053230.1 terminase small subunit [Oxalobacter paeniformigenes]